MSDQARTVFARSLEVAMSDDDVFSRRWVLTEDELLNLLWSCYCGESPDVALIRVHAGCARTPRPRSSRSSGPRPTVTRHFRRRRPASGTQS